MKGRFGRVSFDSELLPICIVDDSSVAQAFLPVFERWLFVQSPQPRMAVPPLFG
jgi:hypothetical protein